MVYWCLSSIEQKTSAPPPKENPGSAPACILVHCNTSVVS